MSTEPEKLTIEGHVIEVYLASVKDFAEVVPYDIAYRLEQQNEHLRAENLDLKAKTLSQWQTIGNHECALKALDAVNGKLKAKLAQFEGAEEVLKHEGYHTAINVFDGEHNKVGIYEIAHPHRVLIVRAKPGAEGGAS